MARSQDSFSKKEKEKKRLKKRLEKQQKKEQRKSEGGGSGLDDMIAYVDAYGNIVDTPPEPKEDEEIDVESIAISTPKKAEEEEETEKFGILDFFNDSKGYGFIKEIGTREKFFVHINGMVDEVNEGAKVSFEVEKGLKGLNAVNVKKAK